MNQNIRKPSLTGGLKIMVVAHPGAGKTRFAGSCGELGKTLILRPPTDNTASIVGTPNVYEWVISDHSTLEDAFQEVRGSKEWGWVWLDSISLWQDTGLDDIWQTVIQEKPQRARYGLDKGEYNINAFRLAGWVRQMTAEADAGHFNFGITAHPRELSPFEDAQGMEVLMPWIQVKNMASKICGYMLTVAYIEVTPSGQRVMHTKPGRRWYAKDHLNALPNGKLVEPTAKKYVEAVIRKGRASRPTTTQHNGARANRPKLKVRR